MSRIGLLEEELTFLKETCIFGSYEYSDLSQSFRTCTSNHFQKVKDEHRFGVYIIRRKATLEVLYIGKGGTINTQGLFKGQNVPGRLRNVKAGDISADKWFEDLYHTYGPLLIEYIFLSTSNSPGLIEAILLQAYLNENNCLPIKNKVL